MNKIIIVILWLAVVTGMLISFSYLLLIHSHIESSGRWVCNEWREGEEYLSRSIIENWVLYDEIFQAFNATITISNITDYNATVSIVQDLGNETERRTIYYTKGNCINEYWVRDRIIPEVQEVNL